MTALRLYYQRIRTLSINKNLNIGKETSHYEPIRTSDIFIFGINVRYLGTFWAIQEIQEIIQCFPTNWMGLKIDLEWELAISIVFLPFPLPWVIMIAPLSFTPSPASVPPANAVYRLREYPDIPVNSHPLVGVWPRLLVSHILNPRFIESPWFHSACSTNIPWQGGISSS